MSVSVCDLKFSTTSCFHSLSFRTCSSIIPSNLSRAFCTSLISFFKSSLWDTFCIFPMIHCRIGFTKNITQAQIAVIAPATDPPILIVSTISSIFNTPYFQRIGQGTPCKLKALPRKNTTLQGHFYKIYLTYLRYFVSGKIFILCTSYQGSSCPLPYITGNIFIDNGHGLTRTGVCNIFCLTSNISSFTTTHCKIVVRGS